MKVFYFFLLVIIFPLTGCDSRQQYTEDESTHENGDLNNSFTEQESAIELTPEQIYQNEKDKLIGEGWQEQEVVNGQLPNCYNFKPMISNVNNSLEVFVGSGTDVVIKVMNYENDNCVRYVFINSSSSYSIKNIPEGKYYLKIGYGKNWISKLQSGQCVGKFIRNPIYEKGDDILDFNIQYSANGYNIPSFRLKLDVISSDISNSFSSYNISEDDFNQ